jgi:acylphosphatase
MRAQHSLGVRRRACKLRSSDRSVLTGEREGANVICRKCLVGGRVQGVAYRASTAHRARELGIAGYARNLPDGRVEVLVIGEASVVNAFVEWLWTGSSAAKVTSVESTDVTLSADQRPAGFTTG